MTEGVKFQIVGGRFAVFKLPPGSDVPCAPLGAEIWSVTVTRSEVSVICPEDHVPNGDAMVVERTWRCVEVEGPLEFELKGVLASLLAPLAEAQVSVFALSTYNTDYLFIKEHQLDRAIAALVAAGHRWV